MPAMSELTPDDIRSRKAMTRAMLIALGIAVAGIALMLLCGFIAGLMGLDSPPEQEPDAAAQTATDG